MKLGCIIKMMEYPFECYNDLDYVNYAFNWPGY